MKWNLNNLTLQRTQKIDKFGRERREGGFHRERERDLQIHLVIF